MQEDYRDSSRDNWSEAAERWALRAEEPDSGASAQAAEWILRAADLRPSERVLEVACGAGRVGLQAAEIVGDAGLVLCSDFAEPMVDAVRERAARHEISNVETRVLDAEQMTFEPDDRFDAALCRFGYMLMGDPLAALSRTREALKPGGRLALAVWGPGEGNPWLSVIFDAVMAELGAPPPEPGTPGPFALGDPERLEGMLAEAGFSRSQTGMLQAEQTYESVTGWWDYVLGLGGPMSALMSAISTDGRDKIRSAALERGAEFEKPDGSAEFPASVVTAACVA